MRRQTENGSLIEQNLLYREGESVRVKKGILKDLIGIIEENMSDEGRVKILFKWLNNTMRACVKYTQLEKAA